MSATIIDGKALAEREKNRTRDRVAELRAQGRSVRLDAVLAASNDDAAARVYAQNQAKMCDALGIEYRLHELPEGAGADDIAGRVLLLNEDKKCHAVMVHMPMPDGVDPYRIQSLIHPEKDVEGVNPANIGNIVYGRSSLAPCTALAVVRLIDESGIELRGKRCVVVGASD
ncbi:MAG: bifunctional 5,10-methylenetetrahydrofolate dehydrogenase/5,10-methenyltetrahydrofolate cyclohydrolase, partial [Planctomycetota bacterium]